jgi:hypothetical protein
MACPKVGDEREGLQIRSVASNILIYSRGQQIRGSPRAWGLDVGLKTPHRKKFNILNVIHKSLGLGLTVWKNANVNDVLVST